MACMLCFPFLPCLPGYFSMELLFYNDLSVLGHAMTAYVCIFSSLKKKKYTQVSCFEFNSLEGNFMSG